MNNELQSFRKTSSKRESVSHDPNFKFSNEGNLPT